MAHYEDAQLHGGPLDGEIVQAPVRERRREPARVIGLPVPVLDEQAETFSWNTANYLTSPRQNARRREGEPWHYSYTRTLPGYPAYSWNH
jgi:hypothetical protein